MITGVISIVLALFSAIPCFSPGGMSAIGVFLSLFTLLLCCFSTTSGDVKYLVSVLIIVTVNIFVISEFSFSLSKKMYSHTETPWIKFVRRINVNNNEENRIIQEQNKKALEEYLGYEIIEDYKNREAGYWQFVRMVFLIIIIPYCVSFYSLYYTWKDKRN